MAKMRRAPAVRDFLASLAIKGVSERLRTGLRESGALAKAISDFNDRGGYGGLDVYEYIEKLGLLEDGNGDD